MNVNFYGSDVTVRSLTRRWATVPCSKADVTLTDSLISICGFCLRPLSQNDKRTSQAYVPRRCRLGYSSCIGSGVGTDIATERGSDTTVVGFGCGHSVTKAVGGIVGKTGRRPRVRV